MRFTKVLSATVLAFMAFVFSASAQIQDFSYTVNNGTVTITKYTGSAGAVTIPDTIDGLPVTSIGISAFGYSGVTSIAIPNSVTNLGAIAFTGCFSLTTVTIPNSVTSIELGVFQNCTSLTNVTFGNRVTSIGWSAFDGCISLTNVSIPNSVIIIDA